MLFCAANGTAKFGKNRKFLLAHGKLNGNFRLQFYIIFRYMNIL